LTGKNHRVGLFFLGLDLDHFSTFVMTTIRAHTMRLAHFTTVAALYQVDCFQGIVGAPTVTAAGRVFSLGLRGHSITPVSIKSFYS
jgi:hypothetical protein